MILTIGYDGRDFAPADLIKILDDTGAVLVDVRMLPRSRLKGWGPQQLRAALGDRPYIHRRDLGGDRTPAQLAPGIEWLRQFDTNAAPHCVLFCKEENPAHCHRHLAITGGLADMKGFNFPDALHIFREWVFLETEYDGQRILAARKEHAALVSPGAQPFVYFCGFFDNRHGGK